MKTTVPTQILCIEGLVFAHAGEAPSWAGWSATIGPGVTSVIGDTGSGKTTLLRLIAGEVAAAHGRFVLGGVDRDADAAAYGRQLCWVDPGTHAHDAVKARDCAAALYAGDAGVDAGLWQSTVEGFALEPHLDKPVYMLSTGTKRKLWLAAALASRRPLLLLDEPAGALDAPSRRCLWTVLETLNQASDRAVIVASGEPLERFEPAAIFRLPVK